ncbi:hypothetical protein VN97_g11401 [Penicillium thymicola]|uniref:Uncharacterized protein n=1 Tax=Penicillium thymicola TaxID=293382 RepID=A0AAI9T8R3_PENTH|nr:hypothetical protein VN97_g11401 [Penicillium thymicola]
MLCVPPPPHVNLDTIDRKGVSPLSPVPSQGAITVESLARIDRDYTLTDLDNQLQAMATQKARVEDFIQQRQLIGKAPLVSSQEHLEDMETCEKALIATRPIIQAMPYVLSDAHSASGLLFHGRRVIDWAFVELTPEAEERFFKPNRMPEVPRNQMPPTDLSSPPPVLLRAGARLEQFGLLQKDKYYVKQGRTTGVTGGVCNGVLPVCRWPTLYDINGNAVDSKDLRTEEFVITGTKGPFIESGDSGLFVVDSTGAVAGLVFAEYTHNLQAVALALTVPDLMETMRGPIEGRVSLRLP